MWFSSSVFYFLYLIALSFTKSVTTCFSLLSLLSYFFRILRSSYSFKMYSTFCLIFRDFKNSTFYFSYGMTFVYIKGELISSNYYIVCLLSDDVMLLWLKFIFEDLLEGDPGFETIGVYSFFLVYYSCEYKILFICYSNTNIY